MGATEDLPGKTKSSVEEIVARLKTPQDCDAVSINAIEGNRPEVVIAAQRKKIELLAEQYGDAHTEAEKECIKAVYAYEEALTTKNGKKTRATYTWRGIRKNGILKAVDKAVSKKTETKGYAELMKMGLQDMAFEAVVLKYPSLFSDEAVQRSKERLGN